MIERIDGIVERVDIGEMADFKYGKIYLKTNVGRVELTYGRESKGEIPDHGDTVTCLYEGRQIRRVVEITITNRLRPLKEPPKSQLDDQVISAFESSGFDSQPLETQPEEEFTSVFESSGFENQPPAIQEPEFPLSTPPPSYRPAPVPTGTLSWSSLGASMWPEACVSCTDAVDPNMKHFDAKWEKKHVTEGGGMTALRCCCFGAACAMSTRGKDVTHSLPLSVRMCSECYERVTKSASLKIGISLIILIASVSFLVAVYGRLIFLPDLVGIQYSLYALFVILVAIWLSFAFVFTYYSDYQRPYFSQVGLKALKKDSPMVLTFKNANYAELFKFMNQKLNVKTDPGFSGYKNFTSGCGWGCLLTIILFFAFSFLMI
ncbi:MAG: hypothetical protein ACXADL_03360 [Candidatus Thorarchaeota archaeon]|jgi:hypothetical protein